MLHKIGIVITDITKLAGTERAVTNLSNICSNLGYEVYIISTDSCSGFPAYSLNHNVKIFHLALHIYNSKHFHKLLEYKKLFKILVKIKESEDIDMFIGTYSLCNVLISFLKNVKCIGCEHFNYSSAGAMHRFLRRLFYRRLDAVVVLTKKDALHYSSLSNCFIIPNSIPFVPIKKESYAQKVVLSIGRYTTQKGYDLLLKAVALIVMKFPDWKFLIVGEGEDEKKLKNQAEQLNLCGSVIFLPPQKNVIALYESASIYCLSSRFEGISLVLMESQACSLPAVSFDCPEGPSEIILDGKTGFLCAPQNTNELAEKLARLMSDEALRKRMGIDAYNASFRYSEETIASQWKKLMEKLYAE